MKHQRIVDLMSITAILITTTTLFREWAIGWHPNYFPEATFSLVERPYIYRALLPWLARGLARITGIDAIACMVFLVLMSSVGLYYAFKYLFTAFYTEHVEIVAYLACELLFPLILFETTVYDIPSTAFIALCLGLLARQRFRWYYILFPIATLNRETTFLLTFFFFVYYLRRISWQQFVGGLALQGIGFFAVRALTVFIYGNRPGVDYLWRPLENLILFAVQPVRTGLYFAGSILIIALVIYKWTEKPIFLRTAFIAIVPVLTLLYWLLGYSFEVRVYADAFPVFYLLAMHTLIRRTPVLRLGLVGGGSAAT